MKVSIVTYTSANLHHNGDEFRDVYENHQDAINDATEDMTTKLSILESDNRDYAVDVVEREVDDQPSVVRIINPNNGFEYEAFIVTEKEVL